MPLIVPVQFVSCHGVTLTAQFSHIEITVLGNRVVEQEHIEVAIPVVVKEGRHGRLCGIIQAISGGLFFKGVVSLVDKQQVLSVLCIIFSGTAHIDIEPAIVVHVGHHSSGAPSGRGQSCFGSNILKIPVSLIDIQAVADIVAGEEQIAETIVVDIACTDTSTVIEVLVLQHIALFIFLQVIAERDPCQTGVCQVELRWLILGPGKNGRNQDQQEKE